MIIPIFPSNASGWFIVIVLWLFLIYLMFDEPDTYISDDKSNNNERNNDDEQ